MYNIYNIGGRLYFNVSAGLPFGYEQSSNEEIPDIYRKLVYGGAVGLITEMEIINRILIIVCVRQNMMFGSKLGTYDYQLYGGLRWYF